MQFQARQDERSFRKPLPLLWKRCATLLLFVFVWDIGFEFLAPFYFGHEHSTASVSVSTPETDPHPDCGLPDHGCALSHHHHFPALLAAVQSIILPVGTEQLAAIPAITAHHLASATSLIRGPPSFLPL